MAEEVSPLYEMRESAVNGDWPLVTSNSFFNAGVFASSVCTDAMLGIRLNFFSCANGKGP
ncbi:Uncharacterised protein [Yersinia enterocolitica]|nr:Uncharacterised protein [Yersinia enterocolitica]